MDSFKDQAWNVGVEDPFLSHTYDSLLLGLWNGLFSKPDGIWLWDISNPSSV